MPPLPRELSDAELAAFFKRLMPGEYNLSVTPRHAPMLSPEGGVFFATDTHTFVVWPHEATKKRYD